MKRPIFVRPLNDAERNTLEAGLRSSDAFTLRRSARSSSPAIGARMLTRSPTLWAAIPRPPATPFTPSTRKDSPGRCGEAPSVRISFTGLSIPSRPRLCGSCFTKTPEVRKTDEPMDVGDGRRSEFRGGAHKEAHQRRNHPGHFGEDGAALGGGQTLDNLS